MDTFDSINLGVFVLIQLLLVARMTFWKRNGQLLGFRVGVCNVLIVAIPCLNFSLWHHWSMPHRRLYQFILESIEGLVCFWKLAQHQLEGWQKAKETQAQKAGRRYY